MRMKNKVKSAFDEIHAGEELKNRTLNFILQTQTSHPRKAARRKFIVPAVCLVLLFFSGLTGIGIYFKPVTVISIDVNPSMELGVNCFDRIISVEGFNEDGIELAEKLNVKYMNYSDAVENILESSYINEYVTGNEYIDISVVSSGDSGQSAAILRNLEKCTGNSTGVYCRRVDYNEVSAAHSCGVSYGKYSAYLELKELYPDIDIEEIKNMTMREIHELIDSCHENTSLQNGHHHNGNGYGYGHRNRNGNGHKNGNKH